MSFDEWVQFVFDHPVPVDIGKGPNWYHTNNTSYEASRPSVLVDYSTHLFKEFKTVTRPYSYAQVNQAVWFLIPSSGSLDPTLNQCLMNDPILPEIGLSEDEKRVDLGKRLECIHAMYYVFADYLVQPEIKVIETGFFMWWDFICGDFWGSVNRHHETEGPLFGWPEGVTYDQLWDDERSIFETMFDTLVRILQVDGVQNCALHGLGHLHHPQVPTVVQKFIDDHRPDTSEEGLKWLEQCRDGTVM